MNPAREIADRVAFLLVLAALYWALTRTYTPF